MDILIKDVETVHSGNVRDAEAGGKNIWIRDDYIHHIGAGKPEKADIVIDGSGMVASPGFVNAHTHAAMSLFRGFADDLPLDTWLQEKIWPAEGKLTAEDVYWGVQLAIAEMIKGGVTSFADMYFFMDEEARAVEEAGIRASLSKGLISIQGDAEKSLEEANDFVSKWHGRAEGRITAMFGPHAPNTCTPEFLKEVVSLAQEKEIGIHIHVAETKSEAEMIYNNYGKSPVELLADIGLLDQHVLAAHCVHVSENDLDILAEKNTFVVHNPQSNLKLGSGIAPVPGMLQRGITVSLGTDGAASNNNLDLIEELRAAALLHKGVLEDPTVVSASDALRMASEAGTRSLGLTKLGKLEPGNKADLVLIDFNKNHLVPEFNSIAHLVYSCNYADVDTVIVDGRILMRGRELKTLDESRIKDEVRNRAKRLVD